MADQKPYLSDDDVFGASGGNQNYLSDADIFGEDINEDRTGRLRTASSQFVRGASDVVTGAVKSVPIAQAENRGDMAALFDRIDAGENVRDPFDAMPVRQEILAEYVNASPEKKAELRASYANPDDPRNSAVYQAGEAAQQAVEDAMPVDPEYAQEFWAGSVPRGLGTTLAFAGVGALGRGVGLGATVPAGVAGAAMSSAGQFEEALESGASFEDAFEASGYGGLTGAIEGVPIGRLFDRLDKATGGSVKRGLIDAVKQGTEEAIQEFVQTVGDNLIANNLVNYDPDRGTFEGAGEASGTGFTVGALMQIVGGLVVGRRARNAASEEAATDAPEQTEDQATTARPESVPEDYTPFYGEDGSQIGWISPDRMTAVPMDGGVPTGPDGERQKAAQKPVEITPEDEASPIDTSDISEGKAFIDDALASDKANRALREAGIPDVQSEVSVGMPDGTVMKGIIADGARDDRGAWARVMLENGETIEDRAEAIAQRIAQPQTAAPQNDAPTEQPPRTGPSDEQIAMQNDALQRGGFPPIGEQITATLGDGSTVTGTVDAGYYLPDDTPVMRVRSDDGTITAISAGEATVSPAGATTPASQTDAPQQAETAAQDDVAGIASPSPVQQSETVIATDVASEQGTPEGATAFLTDDMVFGDQVRSDAAQQMTGTGPKQVISERTNARRSGGGRAFGPEDVISFLSRRGGIRDDEEHALLKSRDMKRFTPRSGPLVRKTGMSMDDAGEALHEAGYFGPPATTPRPDTSEVLDLLERAMSAPTYTAEDQAEALKAQEAADAKEAEAVEAEMRADIKSVSRDMGEIFSKSDIDAIMKIMADEKTDAEISVSEYAERQAIQYAEAVYKERSENDADAIPFFSEEVRPYQDGGTFGSSSGRQERQRRNAKRREAISAPTSQDRGSAAEKARQPVTDTTDQGQQTVIPGAERIADRELAERRMEGRKASAKPQKDADFGLFDTGARNQQDMFDAPPPKPKSKPDRTSKAPASEAGVSDSGKQSDRTSKDDKKMKSGSERKRYRLSDKANAQTAFDTDQLRKRLSDVGLQDKIAVKIVDQIMGGQAEASYVDGLVSVAMTAENPVRALDHEIIHALRDLGVIRDLEWKAVSRAAMKDTARVKDIKTRYKDLKLNDDQIAEEAVAEMFADLGTKSSGAIKRTVKRITNFFEAIGNWLRGSGFRSADDVFAEINRGEIGERSEQASSSDVQYSLAPQKKLSPFDEMVLRPSRSVIEAMTTSTGGMIDALKAGASTRAIGESVDRWRTAFQDQYLPLLRVQNAVEESIGRKLTADENAYRGEELSSKRGAKLEDLAEKHVRPLIEEMHSKSIKVEELEAYLYARHAPERNKHISEINPKFKPGEGSGMTDAEAKSIMDAVNRSGKADDYIGLAKRVDRILDLGMKERVDAGLLSQEQADQWRQNYKHYVPLRGRSEVDPFSGSDRPRQGGSGVSVSGKESQQAFGRKTPARDILAYAIMQTEEAIIRAETNRVAQRVFKLAEAAPDDRFWKVNKVGYKPVLDPATDTVVYRPINAIAAEDRDYTIVGKFDGKQRRLTFNRDNPTAARLAMSLRNLDGEHLGPVAAFAAKVNRYLSSVNTSMNPEFFITNAFRDLQTAGFNLLQYDEKGLIRNTLKDYPKALAGSMKGAFGKDDGSEWVKAYNEFRAAGGRVYFNQIEDVDQQAKKLKRAFADLEKKGGFKKAFLTAIDTIENFNIGVENAVRLSAFKNARKAGMTAEEAASLAKNLTVNFNRRGSKGAYINAWYLFYNAAMQGNHILLSAARSSRVRKAMGAAAVLGAMEAIYNVMASPEDDDGELIYDKISEFDKSRNMIIMKPGADADDPTPYFKIPLPYGYNVFPAIGRAMVEAGRGKSFGDVAGPLATTFIDSFNPIGGSGDILNLMAPTIADPIVDLSLNKDFADRPIMPKQDQYGPQVPDSQRYWDSVNPIFRSITDTLNEATGGDEVRPGAVDISPETLEHLFGYLTGGAGTFIERNAGLIEKLSDPTADVSVNDIAFARKVIGQKPTWYDKAAAYERINRIEQVHADLKSYAERGMSKEVDQLVDNEERVLALRTMARGARRALSQIRKEKDVLTQARDNNQISQSDYAESYEVLKEQERSILTTFNREYIKATSER